MDNYCIKPINETHNEAMLNVLASANISAKGLNIYFDKKPDIFTISKMKYAYCMNLGLFNSESLGGFGSIGYYDALVENKPETIFHFFNFYVVPEARGNKFMHRAADQFFSATYNNASLGFSVTLKGNTRLENQIGKQPYASIPHSRTIDSLVVKTIVFSFPQKNNTPYKVQRATIENIPEIVNLLREEHSKRFFGNIIREESFLSLLNKKKGLRIDDYYLATDRNGKIVGVCAAWDCSPFRQTRVLHYSKEFWPHLLGYKLSSRILGMPPFPVKGGCFRELTITDYAVKDRDPAIMHALLTEVYNSNRKKGYHFMNWGSCGSDPLLAAAKGFWHKNIVSNIVLACTRSDRFNIKTPLPYVDIAFL